VDRTATEFLHKNPSKMSRKSNEVIPEAPKVEVRFAKSYTEFFNCFQNDGITILPHPKWFESTKYIVSDRSSALYESAAKVYLDTENASWKVTTDKTITHPYVTWISLKKGRRFTGTKRFLNELRFRDGDPKRPTDSVRLTDHGDTILLLAIQHNYIDAAMLVIRIESNTINGMKLDPGQSVLGVSNEKRITPIILAAQVGQIQIVRVLMSCHVKIIDHTFNPGSFVTALGEAALYGHYSIIEFILDSNKNNPSEIKALVDTQRWSSGGTPLLIASDIGHLSIVQLLLKYKADANRSTNTLFNLL
jgi:hypothetical protein